MSALKIITGTDALTARRILSWFSRQAEEVQVKIMRRKHHEFMRLRNQQIKFSAPVLDLAALVLASQRSGWSDEQAYRSSKSINETSARGITQRRQANAKAYQSHRDQVRAWLAKHWGKVMDIRRSGLSWRRVADMLADEHGISVSHTTLHSYWRSWNEQE